MGKSGGISVAAPTLKRKTHGGYQSPTEKGGVMMSWWKKVKIRFDGFKGLGNLTDSLEFHVKIVNGKHSVESILQHLEEVTGFVRSGWTEGDQRKALDHSNWKVRALALGNHYFPLSQASFNKAMKEPEWFPKLVFVSRPDVFLTEEQVSALLTQKEDVVTNAIRKRQPEWRAKEESDQLKARFGVNGQERQIRDVGPAL
jgi:hypothetical protein